MNVFSRRPGPSHSSIEPGSPRCSFCGKSDKNVRQLVASTRATICDECVQICRDVILNGDIVGASLADSPEPAEPLVQCALCWEVFPAIRCVPVEDRGRLCTACLEAVKHSIETSEGSR